MMKEDGPQEPGENIKLIIFDMYGTLRRTTVEGKPCPHAPGEWELLPGVREKFTCIAGAQREIRFGAASNQDQVAYGLLTERMAVQLIEDLFNEVLGASLTPVIRICPHPMDAGCGCRKPEPGMLLSVMRDCGATPGETLFVGDTELDREAARRAGVSFIWAWDFFGWNHNDNISAHSSCAH
jgi:D-glycero-D-manno-heptose 1,7-bisphosphate phosphatase